MEIIAEKKFKDGTVIFREGSQGDCVYIVEAGAVIISKEVGSKKIIIDVLRRGEVFGEMAFIGSFPRSATARTLGETTLGVIDRASLISAVDSLPRDLKKLFVSLVARLRKMTDTAAGMTILRKEPRMARKWSLTFSSGDELTRAYTQNASSTGLFIATDQPLAPGDFFLLDLALPSGQRLDKVACEVVWNRTQTDSPEEFPVGMGIRFVVLAEEDRKQLVEALKNG